MQYNVHGMQHDILLAFWVLLPAAAANVAPIFSNIIPVLNRWKTPLDCGLTFKGKQILGPHKTWRGLVSGVIAATAILWVQQIVITQNSEIQAISGDVAYDTLPTLILGPLFGLGALGGDAIESFFKRLNNIPSGHSWFPFDQLDYIAGAIIVTLPFFILSLTQYLWIIVVWTLIHLCASYIGWKVGLKEKPI